MASMMRRVTISIPTGSTAAVNRKNMLAATTPGAASHTMRKIGGTFFSEWKRSCQSCLGIHTVSALAIFFLIFIWGTVLKLSSLGAYAAASPNGLKGIYLGTGLGDLKPLS